MPRAATSAPPAATRPVPEPLDEDPPPQPGQRLCRRCRSPLDLDDDVCRACGERNPVAMPWWGPLAGAAMLALIAYFLVDFTPLIDLINRWLKW